MKSNTLFLVMLISLVCCGCGTEGKYGCPYTQGVTCKSLSTVYKESLSGELEEEKRQQQQENQNAGKSCKLRQGAALGNNLKKFEKLGVIKVVSQTPAEKNLAEEDCSHEN